MPLRHQVPRPPEEPATAGDEPPAVSARAVTTVAAGAVTVLLVLALLLVPLPYAIQRPGPTVDTLSEVDGVPLIEVDDAETYPTTGELRLTTVSVSGGPGYPVTAADVLAGWLSGTERVQPVEALFPEGTTREELDDQSTAQMTSSQTNATVAALTELGHQVPAVLAVEAVVPDADAHGEVQPGDVLLWIQPEGAPRTDLVSFADLSAVLDDTPPGTDVALGLRRDGREQQVEVTTMAPGQHGGQPDGGAAESTGGSLLGVLLLPDLEVPVDVSIAIENIGGPSAGTMFALGIIDVLTPGEMTGGQTIAGTGTMSLDGDVGPIGGIQQKLAGAVRDGAEYFLAPAGNCDEVVGHVPDGLTVVAVQTLAEARQAVESIGSDAAADLPSCER